MQGGTGWQPGWPGTHTQHRLAALPAGSSGDALLTDGSPPPGTGGNLWEMAGGLGRLKNPSSLICFLKPICRWLFRDAMDITEWLRKAVLLQKEMCT